MESDIVHGRRADGRDLDWVLHVNPQLESAQGMLCIYNPLTYDVKRKLNVDLYFTGIKGSTQISNEGEPYQQVDLAADGSVDLDVEVPAGGMTWLVFRRVP